MFSIIFITPEVKHYGQIVIKQLVVPVSLKNYVKLFYHAPFITIHCLFARNQKSITWSPAKYFAKDYQIKMYQIYIV
jgi:hypothetical protein